MFGLFGKKDKAIKVKDKVVIDPQVKWKKMFDEWSGNKETVMIFWFDESLDEAARFFAALTSETLTLLTARETSMATVNGRPVLFAEHYPLRSKEEELFQKLGLQEVTVYSALEEPLFKRFGSGKIIGMMKQLGMKEDELVEHALISKSIRNAQEKIEDKLVTALSSRSQGGWLEKNFPTEKD